MMTRENRVYGSPPSYPGMKHSAAIQAKTQESWNLYRHSRTQKPSPVHAPSETILFGLTCMHPRMERSGCHLWCPACNLAWDDAAGH